LDNAQNVGFDVPQLCTELFQRFKQKYKLDVDKDGEQRNLVKSANEMLRAWKWLTFCGTETIWDAIIEANYLLRKFFCK